MAEIFEDVEVSARLSMLFLDSKSGFEIIRMSLKVENISPHKLVMKFACCWV